VDLRAVCAQGAGALSRQPAPFNFNWANVIPVPLQALAVALLPLIVWLRRDRRIASLAAYLFFALIINAVICGALSNPHDRYQSRLAWLAPLVVVIAALGWRCRPSTTYAMTAVKAQNQGPAVIYRKLHPY
jgi:hypothetical protein